MTKAGNRHSTRIESFMVHKNSDIWGTLYKVNFFPVNMMCKEKLVHVHASKLISLAEIFGFYLAQKNLNLTHKKGIFYK